MEARTILYWMACAAACLPTMATAQTYRANSENFVVFAPDRQLARQASELAEKYRRELSIDWLGYEIPQWRERCPVQIQIGPHAGGETSFAFINSGSGKGQPISWQMKIYGPPDRLLDAVLPHEITHTIFATHFGQPLPRWADEGACTTVEHESEREKNHRMLIGFLTASPSRGIPFNRMFTMKQYPHDILPLYAQGYSVAKFLINQKGRQHFVKYLEYGISQEQSDFDTSTWDRATDRFYNFKDLSDLQVSWENWVRSGSPLVSGTQVAAATNSADVGVPFTTTGIVSDPQTAANAMVPIATNLVDPASTYAVASAQEPTNPNPIADSIDREIPSAGDSGNWYARQSRGKQAVAIREPGAGSAIRDIAGIFAWFAQTQWTVEPIAYRKAPGTGSVIPVNCVALIQSRVVDGMRHLSRHFNFTRCLGGSELNRANTGTYGGGWPSIAAMLLIGLNQRSSDWAWNPWLASKCRCRSGLGRCLWRHRPFFQR